MWVSYAIRVFYHQHHNFFRLRPGQAESRQSLVAHPGVGAAGPGKPLFRFGVPVIMLVHTLVAVYVWK